MNPEWYENVKRVEDVGRLLEMIKVQDKTKEALEKINELNNFINEKLS